MAIITTPPQIKAMLTEQSFVIVHLNEMEWEKQKDSLWVVKS